VSVSGFFVEAPGFLCEGGSMRASFVFLARPGWISWGRRAGVPDFLRDTEDLKAVIDLSPPPTLCSFLQ